MITTAAGIPEQGLRDLWEVVFGDSRDYIDFFFSRRFQPQQTLVDLRDGVPAAMLFLLDVSLRVGDYERPGYYLYAAGTLPRFRKQGIMGSMLEEARRVAKARGRWFIALKPAAPELFGYYKKHGYQTVFYRQPARVAAAGECSAHTLTPGELLEMQGDRPSGSQTIWPFEALEYAMLENGMSGSALLCESGSKRLALLYQQEGDACYISDCWGDGALLPAAIASLHKEEAVVSAPPWYHFPAEASPCLVPHGMLLPVGGEPFFSEKAAYLTLTLG